MKNKNYKKEIIIVIIILIVQSVVFLIAGINKSYIHMDEAYSLGLASYNKTEIQQNSDFYNTWHNKEYYEDYLCVNDDEKNDLSMVYENQKNDVHPPLYYLFLRLAMQFNINFFSKWPGIILNMIMYIFITIFMYLIIKKILPESKSNIIKSAILALISSLTLASINNAIYIRMYSMSTLNIVITTYLHLKLLDYEKINLKVLLLIGISALIGSLTHYYYLFYLIALFFMFSFKYLKEKKYKHFFAYSLTLLFSGIFSIMIFPYSINHIFFSYRGQGVISNILNISDFLKRICQYIYIINVYIYNNTLFLIVLFMIGMIIYKKTKKIKLICEKNKYIMYIFIPTTVYFLFVAVSAPWIELRYIMPIGCLIFILIWYLIENIVRNLIDIKIILTIFIVLLILMPAILNIFIDLSLGKDRKQIFYSRKDELVENLITRSNIPFNILKNFNEAPIDNTILFIENYNIEPEVLYSNKSEIVNILKEKYNSITAIYLFNSSNNRFLDDILLFTIINESYIAKDILATEENINEILFGKDISKGILIFINDGQDSDGLIEKIKKILNFKSSTYLQRLNACDVYFIK